MILNNTSLLSHSLVSFSDPTGGPRRLICYPGQQASHSPTCLSCFPAGSQPVKAEGIPRFSSFTIFLSAKAGGSQWQNLFLSEEIRNMALRIFKRPIQLHTTPSDELGIWTQLPHISSFHHVMFPMHSPDLPNHTVRSCRAEATTNLAQETKM